MANAGFIILRAVVFLGLVFGLKEFLVSNQQLSKEIIAGVLVLVTGVVSLGIIFQIFGIKRLMPGNVITSCLQTATDLFLSLGRWIFYGRLR